MNNISVKEAVAEFEKDFLSYKVDVSVNHAECYDPEILQEDQEAYSQFMKTDMFKDILSF